jgi:hypothetical protein
MFKPMLNDMGHRSLQNYSCHLGTVLDVLGNSLRLWPTPSHLLPRLKTRPSKIHYQCSVVTLYDTFQMCSSQKNIPVY